MQKFFKKDNNKAFSLIELAVVILIIGIYIYLGVEFVFASVRHILLCKDR